MNSTTNSTIRAVLVAIGTILATLGVVSADKWGTMVEPAMIIIGALFPIGSIIWSRIENVRGDKTIVAAMNAPKQPETVTLATLPEHAPALAAAVATADAKAKAP